ncbi:MAG: S41 family peptidase [Niabella sp.]
MPFVFICLTIISFHCRTNSGSHEAAVITDYDTSAVFKKTSRILSNGFVLSGEKVDRLRDLEMVWGFLKYHHPALQTGSYNWDNQLFGLIPKMLDARSDAAADSILESLVDGLGRPPYCKDCPGLIYDSIKLNPDYAGLFERGNLPRPLARKLEYFKEHAFKIDKPFFVQQNLAEYPSFINEPDYGPGVPNVSVRLLALFRYWNIVQYYYPYRYLVRGWDSALTEFIPRFAGCGNELDYAVTFRDLISRLGDSHATVSENPALEGQLGGNAIPLLLSCAEGRIVISGDITPGSQKMSRYIGDVVTKIDGTDIDTLVAKFVLATPGSNYERKLYSITYPGLGALCRTHNGYSELEVMHENAPVNLRVKTVPSGSPLFEAKKDSEPKLRIIDDSIGYLNANRLKDGDFAEVCKALNDTKGIVIDLRRYPGTFMPYAYDWWLKPSKSAFLKTSKFDFRRPGRFYFLSNDANGYDPLRDKGTDGKPRNTVRYKGGIAILVNSGTISQGELTAMAFRSIPGAVVVGSTTAGADGTVTPVPLPGNIKTLISGTGIYYPDGSETQQVGIKIDSFCTPTIAGIKQGKDELLLKAVEILKGRK